MSDAAPPPKPATYEVSVTVECCCTIIVTASTREEAEANARAAYDRGRYDVDEPFHADWRGVEVERQS